MVANIGLGLDSLVNEKDSIRLPVICTEVYNPNIPWVGRFPSNEQSQNVTPFYKTWLLHQFLKPATSLTMF